MAEEEEPQTEDLPEGESEEEPSAQDSVGGGEKSHISVPEAMFALLICLGVDLMEIFFSLVGIAWLLTPIDFGVSVLFIMLFAFKGGGSSRRLKKNIIKQTLSFFAELIPILEMLPIRTTVMIWIIYDWNKESDSEAGEGTKKGIDYYERRAAKFVGGRLGD